MKKLYYLFLLILFTSCASEYTIDDVNHFKRTTDTTKLLLSKLSIDGKISKVLIWDSISEVLNEDVLFNNIYYKKNITPHKHVWNESFILEEIDSIDGISKDELSLLKDNLYRLYEKYNINLVTSKMSNLDTSFSDNIYYYINTMGEYYDLRYLSFLTEETKQEFWYKDRYTIVWEKDGLSLFRHRY